MSVYAKEPDLTGCSRLSGWNSREVANSMNIALVVAALLLAGCTSGVIRLPNVPVESRAPLTATNQVASVSLSLTDVAKLMAMQSPLFNRDELFTHVKRALEANSLLNDAADKPRPSLEVRVKDLYIRSFFAAVMLGGLAGSDSISADIVLKDPAGKVVDRFEVSALYSLGGFYGGLDSVRMEWLYKKFAEETVNELMK